MITQAELKRHLHYDPATGIFRRIQSRSGKKAGSVAGYTPSEGYTVIKLKYNLYKAHRLAWLYMYGYFPEHQIDHRNGINSDNSISNLRHVSQYCNLQNCRVSKNNKSGFPGVYWSKSDSMWRTEIGINNKNIYIGCFPTQLEAALARFTVEVQCPNWTCNHRSNLVKAIKAAWPSFNPTP